MTSSSGLSESLRKVLGVMVAAPVNGFPCSLARLGEEQSWRTAFWGSALLAAPCVWIAEMLNKKEQNRKKKSVLPSKGCFSPPKLILRGNCVW